jgi:hypothetical protein
VKGSVIEERTKHWRKWGEKKRNQGGHLEEVALAF